MSRDWLKPRTHRLSLRMKIILAAVACVIVAAIVATFTDSAANSASEQLFVDKNAGPLSAAAANAVKPSAPLAQATPGGIAFSHNTIVDFSATSG